MARAIFYPKSLVRNRVGELKKELVALALKHAMDVLGDGQPVFVAGWAESHACRVEIGALHGPAVANFAGKGQGPAFGPADIDPAEIANRQRFFGTQLEAAEADIHDDGSERLPQSVPVNQGVVENLVSKESPLVARFAVTQITLFLCCCIQVLVPQDAFPLNDIGK